MRAAGCTCQLADNNQHSGCPTGLFGWRATAQAPRAGQWFYVVAQANPPETGVEDGGRRFSIDVDRWPA